MKRTGLIAMCLMLLLTFALAGCGGKKVYETQYFKYHIWGGSGYKTDAAIAICGLTSLGNQQKILIVPDEIDGIKVTEIVDRTPAWGHKGQWESDMLEKVFLQNKVEVVSGLLSGCSNLVKVFIINVSDPSGSIFDIGGLKYIYSEKYYGSSWSGGVHPANVTYYFNYETDENYGIYWIDDCDYGGIIEFIPPVPERTGYTFGGWFTEPECITEWDLETDRLPKAQYDENEKEIYQETQLYAKWIKN